MPTAEEIHALKRDRRIRRSVLSLLHDSRSGENRGWRTGSFLLDLYGPEGSAMEHCDSERQLLGLVRDLVNAGFAEEFDVRTHKSQTYGLNVLTFRVTANGSALITEAAPVNPMIDDARIAK